MSFKRILVRARMTGKPVPDFVIVKDYGKAAGLVLFFPLDIVSPGRIQCYSALRSPDPKIIWNQDDVMTFDDVDLSYFYKGRAPKKDDARIALFLHRYEYDIGIAPVRVYKDRAEYREYRHKI